MCVCAQSLSCDPQFVIPWTVILCPLDFPGNNTGVGCHFCVQQIFPTQGWSPHLLHWQVESLPPSHLGSPDIVSGKDKNLHPSLDSLFHTDSLQKIYF